MILINVVFLLANGIFVCEYNNIIILSNNITLPSTGFRPVTFWYPGGVVNFFMGLTLTAQLFSSLIDADTVESLQESLMPRVKPVN